MGKNMELCLYIWKKVYRWPDEQALLQFEGLIMPIKNIKCEQKMLISHRHILCRVQNICNAESIVLSLTVKMVHNRYTIFNEFMYFSYRGLIYNKCYLKVTQICWPISLILSSNQTRATIFWKVVSFLL